MFQLYRTTLLAVLFTLLALLLAACPALPLTIPVAAPTVAPVAEAAVENGLVEVSIVATEYAFDGPETLSTGWTRFTLDNQGELAHDFILFKVEEGKTIDDVMAAMQAGPPEWAHIYGAARGVAAGESSWLATNLTPGSYIYMSFGEVRGGPPDVVRGMHGALTVTGTAVPVGVDAPIEANASIQLIDYQFVIEGDLTAGEQVLRVSNTGVEIHEVVFYKLKEGKTRQDFQAELEEQMATPGPPAESTTADMKGGIFLSPDVMSLVPQEFEAGEYILICHVPSQTISMMRHFELGMISQVTIQ
jgi:uncharacterized cupredoxin-like copper-binding protein